VSRERNLFHIHLKGEANNSKVLLNGPDVANYEFRIDALAPVLEDGLSMLFPLTL